MNERDSHSVIAGYGFPGEYPHADADAAWVGLNDYQLRNLRWLLRHAWHGTAPQHLNTGDWCGEILWAIEQLMLDRNVTGRDAWANGPDGGWPIQGFGKKRP